MEPVSLLGNSEGIEPKVKECLGQASDPAVDVSASFAVSLPLQHGTVKQEHSNTF